MKDGLMLGYVSDAEIFHVHDESWKKIKNRFEREAIALKRILPEVHVTFGDFLRYFLSSVWFDVGKAIQQNVLRKRAFEIISYRLAQYWGTYRGNHAHLKLTKKLKDNYFFPK